MKIKLEAKPMSVNKAWKGRKFKTKEYQDYEGELLWLLKLSKLKPINGFIEIDYKFYIKNYKISDVGNFEKPLADILVKSKLINDDRFIKRIVMEKFESEINYIEIEIKKYE